VLTRLKPPATIRPPTPLGFSLPVGVCMNARSRRLALFLIGQDDVALAKLNASTAVTKSTAGVLNSKGR
jgi:hypothetical protein